MKEVKKFYHCTTKENWEEIQYNGLNPGMEGVIYLADSPVNAAKFLIIRGIPVSDIIAIELDAKILNKKELIQTYDHSESFFKCKAYGYSKKIESQKLFNCNTYSFGKL